MKRLYNCEGLHTLAKKGSLVFCNECNRIIASINKQGYREISIRIRCICSNYGKLEISRMDSIYDLCPNEDYTPLSKDGVMLCRKCKNPLFGIIDERVYAYHFDVECICGARYSKKPIFENRLGETLKLIKNK